MSDTDRKRIKDLQEGVHVAIAGITNARTSTHELHRRTRDFLKVGSENAATNVAETYLGTVHRKSKAKNIGITSTNVATDNTDYTVIKFFKRKAGVSTLVGSWNTHGGAQGALTDQGPNLIALNAGLITNSDAEFAENSMFTYTITKAGAGKAIPQYATFSPDFEEI